MKAVLRTIRISPKKANLVAGTVRGMGVKEALALLKFMPKKGAKILYKIVHSAAYNAKNNFNQSLDDLLITKILVTKGPTYKRSLPISRGRVHPIAKRTSHITVEVGSLVATPAPKKEMAKPKVEKKKEVSEEKEVAKKAVAPKKSVDKKEVKKD